jgi:hypothetical protein
MRGARKRLTTGLLLMPVMAVFLVLAGTSAFGKPKPSAAQYQYKVTICHKTGSKKKPAHAITVSSRAVAAHLAHGDTLGPCVSVVASAAPTSGSSEQGEKQGKGHTKDKDKTK